jgi:nicotinate-nucleotide pyrophosphorylase (carboxylating)
VTDKPAALAPSSVLATVEDEVLHLIDLAIEEDRGSGDWTSRWIVPARLRIRARVLAGAPGIVAGLTSSMAVFHRLDGRIETNRLVDEGQRVAAGDVLYELKGPGRAVLSGERIALNFLQHLSGIATLTRAFADAIAGTAARILDTRKTTPGWRGLEKAAVRAGGGMNHRHGLFDAVLIKDNHIAIAGSLEQAIERVREHNTKGLPVIAEVSDLVQLDGALKAGVDRILLDNMDLETIRESVRRARRRKQAPPLEASGNMTLDRVRAVADAGVDFISVGALTHSAPALDVTLDVLGS